MFIIGIIDNEFDKKVYSINTKYRDDMSNAQDVQNFFGDWCIIPMEEYETEEDLNKRRAELELLLLVL